MIYKRKLAATGFLLILSAGLYFLYGLYDDYLNKKKIDDKIVRLARYIEPKRNFHDRIDAVRAFIQEHSEHNINKEFKSLWRDPEQHFTRVLQGVEDQEISSAPMECSTRADLMRRLLESMGVQARIVDIFSYKPEFKAHTFIEVFNPQTGTWEISDPDLNLFWKDPNTHQRASIKDIISDGTQHYVPCKTADQCGWGMTFSPDAAGPEKYRHEDYFFIARTRNLENGDTHAFYNSKQFDLHKQLTHKDGNQKSFCETWRKVCELNPSDLAPHDR